MEGTVYRYFLPMKRALITISFFSIVFLWLGWWIAEGKRIEHVPIGNHFRTNVSVSPSVLTPRVETYFKELFTNTRFSGNVLVAHRGKVIYKQAKGWRSYSQRDSLAMEDVFQLASVSKQFTALSVVLLKQQGLINYTDSVAKYLPDFPYKDITIHHLLSHQTGLQNYMYFAETLAKDRRAFGNKVVLKMLKDNSASLKPYWPAGHRFYYSNTGYAILALLVEEVSGIDFSTFLQKNFFEPAKMNHSYVGAEDIKKNLRAEGHYFNRRRVLPFYQDAVVGDKSIYSSIEDLYRWDRFLNSDKGLKLQELDTAFQFHAKAPNHVRGYGYGWRLWHYPDGRKIEYHTGWYRGYTALFVRIRETDSTIIILSNIVNRNFMRTFHDLVDILYV